MHYLHINAYKHTCTFVLFVSLLPVYTVMPKNKELAVMRRSPYNRVKRLMVGTSNIATVERLRYVMRRSQ